MEQKNGVLKLMTADRGKKMIGNILAKIGEFRPQQNYCTQRHIMTKNIQLPGNTEIEVLHQQKTLRMMKQ